MRLMEIPYECLCQSYLKHRTAMEFAAPTYVLASASMVLGKRIEWRARGLGALELWNEKRNLNSKVDDSIHG